MAGVRAGAARSARLVEGLRRVVRRALEEARAAVVPDGQVLRALAGLDATERNPVHASIEKCLIDNM